MNQDYQKEEFALSSEEKKKSIIIPDDTGNDGGKPRPEGVGSTSVDKGDDDEDPK